LGLKAEGPAQGKGVTYIKAMTLREYSNVEAIKRELSNGNVVIVKITPLVIKDIDEARRAIDELKSHVASLGGDIARLGDERLIATPAHIRIWRKGLGEG